MHVAGCDRLFQAAHSADNIEWICLRLNSGKRDFPDAEYRDWAQSRALGGTLLYIFHFVYFIYIIRCFLNFSFIILSNYYNLVQIPKALRQRLPAITFNSSEFGVLSYADYWAICMRM